MSSYKNVPLGPTLSIGPSKYMGTRCRGPNGGSQEGASMTKTREPVGERESKVFADAAKLRISR